MYLCLPLREGVQLFECRADIFMEGLSPSWNDCYSSSPLPPNGTIFSTFPKSRLKRHAVMFWLFIWTIFN